MRKFRLLLVALVLIGAAVVLWRLDRHPVHVPAFDAVDPEAPSRTAYRDGDAPVLLVTSLERISDRARAGRFPDADLSTAWLNPVRQEFGDHAHVDVRTLRPESLANRTLVIVTRSAIDTAPVEALGAFVARGGTLLLECPGERWRAVAGVAVGPLAPARPGRITDAAPTVLAADERTAIDRAGLELPFATAQPSGPVADDARSVLAVDGRPVVWTRAVGPGHVVVCGFDVGRLLVTVQQGLPEADYRVRKRWGFYEHVLESHDLVCAESLLKNAIPIADVVERAIFAATGVRETTPGWWAFPDRAPGLLLMTHDEDEYGAAQCDILREHERSIGARATYFLIAGRRLADGWRADDARRFADDGADLALHWNQLPMLTGIWKVEPISRQFALIDQVDWFRALRRDAGIASAPILNRNHYLTWASPAEYASGDTHYTRNFRRMYRHGIVVDSTYGPNRGGRGYLFGTGRPFVPIDTDGQPIPVREIPFVSQEDWGGEDEAWFARLFAESESRYHCAITTIFHPHLIVREPDGNRLWKAVYRLAAAHRHPARSVRDYQDYLERRARSRIRRAGDGWQLDARGSDLSVVLAGRPAAVLVDGRTAEWTPIGIDGRPHVLVAVPAGRSTLTIRR